MGNAPQKTAEYSQLLADCTMTSPEEKLTFCLEPFGLCRSRVGMKGIGIGGSVTLKLNHHHAELWSNTTSSQQPIQRWALANVASWGHTSMAVRLIVIDPKLDPYDRVTFDFKTPEGAHITSAFKRLSDQMVRLQNEALKLRVREVMKGAAEPENCPMDTKRFQCDLADTRTALQQH